MKGRKNERERVVDKGWEDGWRESRTSGSMNEWMDGWEMGKGKRKEGKFVMEEILATSWK